ncbi:amino acid--tRNA ligase-related protein [Streptomyces qinglanensis]|uniref:amino acid--tRNA ligase-related protein n=1 Tax=Streptomyces qinglanensis TaxID=943816 RepID=UPI0037AAAC38
MLDPITMKSDVLYSLRDTLRAGSFVEVVTPVARRADLGPGRRAAADLDGGRFLRAMIGPALRVHLEHHPRIFEIGPCFRPEKPDELHACEFTMLDLYAAGEDFAFLFSLAERLVAPHIPHTPVRISVAEHIRDTFGINLRREGLGDLPAQMAAHLRLPPTVPFKDVLGQYVERELEPRSAGTAVFLTDYPLGGDEPCARLTPGATATINRFELIVDGLEVVHGYEDEPDGAAFAERARAVDLYDEEQRLAWEAIEDGRVPAASVGLGVGIERLCMAASGIKDIRRFLQSPQY